MVTAVLLKMDVEHPMELVLDAPMAAGCGAAAWEERIYQEIVMHDGCIGALTPQPSAQGNARHDSGTWKAIWARQIRFAHDCDRSHFAPIMAGMVDLLGAPFICRQSRITSILGSAVVAST
nr:hypothetical protein [Bradyrhizobium sp. SEMIA]